MMSLQCITRWLVVGLAAIAAVVLIGLLGQRNMWGWIIAYWSVLTGKNLIDCYTMRGKKK